MAGAASLAWRRRRFDAPGSYAVIDGTGRFTGFSKQVHLGLDLDEDDRVTGLVAGGERAEISNDGRWVGVAA